MKDRIGAALSLGWSHTWQPDALLEALQCHSHSTWPVHIPFLCLVVPCLHYQNADFWATWLCLLIVDHSKLVKPSYNHPHSPHFHRSQAVLNTNQCACQEKWNPIYGAQAAKVCLGLVLQQSPFSCSSLHLWAWLSTGVALRTSPASLLWFWCGCLKDAYWKF